MLFVEETTRGRRLHVVENVTGGLSRAHGRRVRARAGCTEEDDEPGATEMIRRFVSRQEAVVRTARSVFPVIEQAGDEPSADLLTQRMQIHEKNARMLQSLLETG